MSNITIESKDGIATVTLNRPDKLNALSEDMKEALITGFASLSRDESIRVILLTGTGRGFCAGGDVSTMGGLTPHAAKKRIRQAQLVVSTLANVEKPVIAAVRGPVAGIGWSLALACDLIIASETANFHQSFAKIGLVPDGGAVFFLKQILGTYRAKELVYTARPTKAAEALALGLVNKVVPDNELEAHATALAAQLAQGPAFALSITKRMFRTLETPSLDNFLDGEAWAQSLSLLTEDHQEGGKAFAEKRPPRFKGK
jgi:2-(1,2-epoxy-1,2-dihydrophenyl)acetyl-CoA isomerase